MHWQHSFFRVRRCEPCCAVINSVSSIIPGRSSGRCRYVADLVGAAHKRIVDFGSGTGLLAAYLGQYGAGEVLGVEIVPDHLEFARYLAADVFQTSNVTFTEHFNVEEASRDVFILA